LRNKIKFWLASTSFWFFLMLLAILLQFSPSLAAYRDILIGINFILSAVYWTIIYSRMSFFREKKQSLLTKAAMSTISLAFFLNGIDSFLVFSGIKTQPIIKYVNFGLGGLFIIFLLADYLNNRRKKREEKLSSAI
jgi:hypothetical protein